MAELGVRHQRAVDEQGAADPRPEREEQHDAVAVLPGAEAHLGDARGVGVVDDIDRPAGRLLEQRLGVGADPGVVDVRCGLDDAVEDDGRERQADRAGRVELRHDLLHHRGHGVGRRRLWRRDADALGREGAGVEINGRALDAGAADVHTDGVSRGCRCHLLCHLFSLGEWDDHRCRADQPLGQSLTRLHFGGGHRRDGHQRATLPRPAAGAGATDGVRPWDRSSLDRASCGPTSVVGPHGREPRRRRACQRPFSIAARPSAIATVVRWVLARGRPASPTRRRPGGRRSR